MRIQSITDTARGLQQRERPGELQLQRLQHLLGLAVRRAEMLDDDEAKGVRGNRVEDVASVDCGRRGNKQQQCK